MSESKKEEYTEDQLVKMLADKRKAAEAETQKKKRVYEKKKDIFVQDVAQHFIRLAENLKETKDRITEKGTNLHKEMYEIYGKEEKNQNSFSIESADGKFKVVIENQERQSFNEHAEVHINTIKEILRNKFESRNKSMYNIIDSILMKNRTGEYDERLVAKLNKHRESINNKDFDAALDALANCYVTFDSSTYVRAYQKDKTGKWESINIQFSSIK